MSVAEGNTIQYTVNTARVRDGVTLYWRTTGTVNYGPCLPSQIVGSNNGTITVTNNQAVFNVSLNLNQFTDNTRTLGIGLSTTQWGPIVGATAQAITIDDTSRGGYAINYLVVAGGGAGGTGGYYGGGGGGGAGGLLQGLTSVMCNQTYVITVGAGGAAVCKGPNPSGPSIPTANGNNSTIISSTPGYSFNITANGGGGGGFYSVVGAGAFRANPGGSGGGSGYMCYAPLFPQMVGGLAVGSPGQNIAGTQGYPGGSNGGAPYEGAGGGGAGGTGVSRGGFNPANVGGGSGGNGYTWPFTNNTYAGGGSGGSGSTGYLTAGTPGGGGAGGGGQGSPGIAGSGTANTGGGGGGAGGSGIPAVPTLKGGNGGSGIVILAIPTPNYPGAYGPIASTPPAAPGKVVLTFTSSGTYTA